MDVEVTTEAVTVYSSYLSYCAAVVTTDGEMEMETDAVETAAFL